MTQLFFFLTVGAVFLVVLYFLVATDNASPEGSGDALVEARQALNLLQSSLSPELIVRIFTREDLDFAKSTGSSAIKDLFLQERRRVALHWVARVRRHVLSLKQFHSREARRFAQLDARSEIALAFDFASLLLACRLLQIVFYVRGPYAAPRIVGLATGAGGKVCDVSERCLAFLGPVKVGTLRRGSAGGSAAVS